MNQALQETPDDMPQAWRQLRVAVITKPIRRIHAGTGRISCGQNNFADIYKNVEDYSSKKQQ